MRKSIIEYLKEQYENAVRGVEFERNRIYTYPNANAFEYTAQLVRRNAFKEVLDHVNKLEEERLEEERLCIKSTKCPSCKYSDYRDVDRCWDCETGYADGFEQKDGDELKVGDEVINPKTKMRAVVSRLYFNGQSNCISITYRDGSCTNVDKNDYIKTGRHFPQMEELLKQMQEE